jgi:hypothetical protein
MPTQEFTELKDMIEAVDKKLINIASALLTCQSRCHVDNPPSRWRGLGRALLALVRL